MLSMLLGFFTFNAIPVIRWVWDLFQTLDVQCSKLDPELEVMIYNNHEDNSELDCL